MVIKAVNLLLIPSIGISPAPLPVLLHAAKKKEDCELRFYLLVAAYLWSDVAAFTKWSFLVAWAYVSSFVA